MGQEVGLWVPVREVASAVVGGGVGFLCASSGQLVELASPWLLPRGAGGSTRNKGLSCRGVGPASR